MKLPPSSLCSILQAVAITSFPTVFAQIDSTARAAEDFPDEVTVKTSPGNGRLAVTGEIVDYTGKQLILRTGKSRKEVTYAAADVVDVRAAQLAEHAQGLKLFSDDKVAQAETQLEKAHGLERRVWMRREILAELVKCSLRKNDWPTAGSRYLRLHQSDPETRHINLMPLCWDRVDPDVPVRVAAAEWLKESDQAARLMGASVLLLDSRSTASCVSVLQNLSRQPNEHLRVLAQWQLRRHRVYTDASEISDNEIKRWLDRVTEADPPLRAGAYYVLAQGHLHRQEFDLAAATFLRVPFGYASEHPVTSQSMFDAAIALKRTGQVAQSARLLEELIAKYPHTAAAAIAKQRAE